LSTPLWTRAAARIELSTRVCGKIRSEINNFRVSKSDGDRNQR
jgi:hypothetical protein